MRDERLKKEGHDAPDCEVYYQEVDESEFQTEGPSETGVTEVASRDDNKNTSEPADPNQLFLMEDTVLGTSAQTEIAEDYPMETWEWKLKAPYIERWNGNICVRKDDIQGALKYYNKSLFALKMIFDSNKERFMNNPSEACEFVRDIEIPVSLNLAHCYNKTERFHFAIRYCTDVLKNEDENVKALYRRGVAYTGIGEVKRAKEDLCRALFLAEEESPDRGAIMK